MSSLSATASPLDAIASLTAAIGGAHTIESIYEAALDGLRTGFGVQRASVLLFDADGVMRFKAWRGLSDEYRYAVEGHTPWTPAQAAPSPIVVPDVRHEPSLHQYASVFEREHVVSLAFFPLVADGGVIGKFMLYHELPASFSAEQVTAGTAMGYLLGFAVERTRRMQDAAVAHGRTLFALDAGNMGTWDWNLATHDVRWSSNLERVHGLPPGTFTGGFDSYEREIHPEDRARVFASIQRALAHRDTLHDVEYRIVAPDGTVRWVHGKGRVERDEAGTPVRMSGVCMDIGSRRAIEQENARLLERTQQLLTEEETLRRRLTTLTDGSPRLLAALGYDALVREVVDVAASVLPADAYAVWRRDEAQWRVVAARGLSPAFTTVLAVEDGPIAFDEPIVAGDLRAAPLLSSRMGLYQAEGIVSLVSVPLAVRAEVTGSVVFYYRVPHQPSDAELRVAVALGHVAAAAISNAELYEKQQALRQAAEAIHARTAFLAEATARLTSLDYEDNLRVIAQLAASRLCDWCAVDLRQEDGTLRRVVTAHVNPSMAAFADHAHRRYPVNPDVPRGIGHVFRTGTPELYTDVSDDILVASAVDDEHLQALRQVGIRSVMIVPLAAGSRVFGTLSFISSSHERKYDDADLAFATELGRRAAFAIENARLYGEATRANRLKDEFLATLSHELRTPLNVIAGRARMLAAATDIVHAREQGAAIDRNAATLTHLVDDLLDASRMTIGQVRLDRQPVDLGSAATAAVQAVQPAADGKGVTIDVSIASVLSVMGDPIRIQQIVWNLLTNAVKFTPSGGTVRLFIEQTSAGAASLKVVDTGEGIAPAALLRIFDMFWQAEPSAARRQSGLGLGLSLVKKLVELHGGTVEAESAGPGHGSTFVVMLPVTTPQ